MGITALAARSRLLRLGPALRHQDFRRIVLGQGTSAIGSQITKIAVPTIAVVALDASVQAAGFLYVAETVIEALTGPLLGVLADRRSPVRLMILSDIARALAFASVPLSAALGVLTLQQLYVVMLVTGICTALFDICMSKTLPAILSGEALTRANAGLGGLRSAATTGGPAIAGAIIQFIGASRSLLVDTATFLWSAQQLSRLAVRQSAEPAAPRHNVRKELSEGLRALRRRPDIIKLMVGSAIMNFASIGVESMLVYYAYRELGLHAFQLGLVFTCYGIGLAGGFIAAARLYRRLSTRTVVRVAATTAAASFVLVPLAGTVGAPTVLLAAHELLFGAGAAVWGVGNATLLQTAAEPAVLGRVSAVSRSIAISVLPIGVLAGTAAAAVIGLEAALWMLSGIALLAPASYLRRSFKILADGVR